MPRIVALFVCALTLALGFNGYAESAGRLSPHETISAVVDGNMVTVVYGRPFAKHRVIWGGLVPYGKVWRLGADEATLFITQQPLAFGSTIVPPGAYTLAMQPEENGAANLIINKQIGQWGIPYTGMATELARIPLTKNKLTKNVNQLTVAIEKNPAGGGMIKIFWEKTEYSVAFKVQK